MQQISHVNAQLNTAIFAKDLSHRIVYCNEEYAQICGEASPHACVGKTDADFIWKKHAHVYFKSDAFVYQNNPINNIVEPGVLIHDQHAAFLINKNPFFNEAGDIIGVVGSLVNITGVFIGKNEFCLSPNEYQILKHILLGHTAHETGLKLHKSPKTIETYIARIKVKMQCKSRGDLIALAVRSGLYHQLFCELITAQRDV